MIQFFKRQETFLVFLLLLAACFASLGQAFTLNASSRAELNVLSLDEWSFSSFMESNVYPRLINNSPTLLFIQDNWGYGSIFYLLYAFFTWPFFLTGDITLIIISLRYVSIALLAITLLGIYKIVRLNRSFSVSLLASIVPLSLPAFHLFYKPFSAEFLMIAIFIWSILLLLKKHPLAWVILGLGVGTKISLLIPAIPLYLYFTFRQPPQWAIRSIAMMLLGFVLANPFLATFNGANHFATTLRQNLHSNRTAHGYDASRANFVTWYTDVVRDEYASAGILLAWLVLATIAIINKRGTTGLIFTVAAVHYLYTVFFVNTMYYWYLWPSFILLPAGLLSCRFSSKFNNRLVVSLVIILIVTNFEAVKKKHHIWSSLNTSPQFQDNVESGSQITNFLKDLPGTPQSILKSAYLFLEFQEFPHSQIHTEWGYLNEDMIAAYKPEFILYQKNYGIFTPDETAHRWSSYPELISGRDLYFELVQKGKQIEGKTYKYEQVLETKDAIVLKRI